MEWTTGRKPLPLTKERKALFTLIANSLIDRNDPGSTGYRRSLGACKSTWDAEDMGAAFLRFVRRHYSDYRFGLSGVEGTGGTSKLRVRAYLAKAV